jgi:hypothetical protein
MRWATPGRDDSLRVGFGRGAAERSGVEWCGRRLSGDRFTKNDIYIYIISTRQALRGTTTAPSPETRRQNMVQLSSVEKARPKFCPLLEA